ncbi:hypothetical protein [Noviherbaspirillum massiliense]|uniref:hypothetical protein n=1 Tax=Noviherbaspirillum massiliense TaxID=1465823 RepID=UPI0011DCD8BF|nr:hypothetical protein [Noviherbaspirillum massiliense]
MTKLLMEELMVMSESIKQLIEFDAEVDRRIRKKIAEIVEMTVRGISPFDRLPQYLPLNCNREFLLNYTEQDKRELVESFVAFKKFAVAGELFRDEPAWNRVKQLGREKERILRARFVPISSEKRDQLRRFLMKDRKKLVQTIVAKRFPDFHLDKNVKTIIGNKRVNAIIGTVIYSKPVLENNKLLMSFDLGSGKTDGMFDAYIGVEKPLYTVRATNFFAGRYGSFYYTPDELNILMDECLDLLEVLIPIFEQKVKEALVVPPKQA